MSLPPYSSYQETSVPWLGSVPSHWAVSKIKRNTYLKGRVGWKGLSSDEYLETGYAYLVTGTDFSEKFIDWNECHCVDEERYEDDKFIQLRNDDLLITKDGTIGKLALVSNLDRPACLNSGIFLIRPTRDYITKFMYWVLQSEQFLVFCDLSSLGSTIQHLYQNVFENFSFPVPAINEQRDIAVFLDREAAKIDALISEQEKLIKLLAEKRKATISHAVTKGLHPNAPMKDSGLEWLGAVPQHWSVARMGYFATVENGTTPRRDLSEYWDRGDIPWLASGEVNQIHIREAAEFITVQALSECSLRLLPVGTVVVGMIGQGKTRGMSAMLHIAATINQNLAAICPGPKADGTYLLYVFNAVYEWLREAGRGGNQAAMNCQILSALKIPVPPVMEQIEISEYIDKKLKAMQSLSSEAERAIALLNERRTALISAAVTGKIDVRQVVQLEQVAIQEAA